MSLPPLARQLRLLVGVLASLVLLVLVSGAETARAAVVDCNAWVSYPNIKVSSARNMSCQAARREQRRYRGSIGFRLTTPGGFACKRASGGPLGGQWRCVRGLRAYRFEFGD